jgi:phage shock protein E
MSKRAKQMQSSKPSENVSLVWVIGIGMALAIGVGVITAVLLGAGTPNNAVQQVVATAVDASRILTPVEYRAQFEGSPHFLLDVRTVEEFNGEHLANAANISVDVLASRLSEVPTNQSIVVYCRSGNRSRQAAEILRANGYTNVYDLGGIIAWKAAGFPVQSS